LSTIKDKGREELKLIPNQALPYLRTTFQALYIRRSSRPGPAENAPSLLVI